MEGWLVAIAAPDRKEAEEVRSGLSGEGHLAAEVDVRNDDHIDNLRHLIATQWEHYDVLVNSVGISQGSSALESSFSEWDNALQVMLYGAVKCCRSLIALMKDGRRIIHVTSIHHNRVGNGSSACGMPKAAITQFTRSLALELAPRNMLANAVAPGFINTTNVRKS